MPSNDDLTERQLVRLTLRDRDELRSRCRVLGVPPATRVRMLVLEWLAVQRSDEGDKRASRAESP